jgi:hypothetical protein
MLHTQPPTNESADYARDYDAFLPLDSGRPTNGNAHPTHGLLSTRVHVASMSYGGTSGQAGSLAAQPLVSQLERPRR